MPADTPLARWLREEMPRKGYPLHGPRSGGITRLADTAGISRPSLSRIVAGQADPSLDALRKIGRALGQSLGDMLIHAGMAEADELPVSADPTAPARLPTPTNTIPDGISLPDLDVWEQHIWQAPDLSEDERASAIRIVRLLRGTLTDDTKGLLALSSTLNRVIARHLQDEQNPGQAG